jgi:hypothetical protein
MSIGTSLLLIAVGAVLRFAVHVSTSGFNLHTIGVILMIVGAIGLVLSLFWMFSWSERRQTTRYVEREPPADPPARY